MNECMYVHIYSCVCIYAILMYTFKYVDVLLWEWEDLVKKMADFENHRMFTLRCLKAEVTPASLGLKTPSEPQEVSILSE